MVKFTKESNGFTLEIQIDDEKLLTKIDEDIQEMEELKQKLANGEYQKEDDDEDTCWHWDYDMGSVYGDPESDFCTPDSVIKNREDFKTEIKRLAAGDGEELWKMAQLKKNGTFKKNCKPMLKEAINGSYWEDSYGWNTLVMRLEPVSDTLACVKLSHIVLHY